MLHYDLTAIRPWIARIAKGLVVCICLSLSAGMAANGAAEAQGRGQGGGKGGGGDKTEIIRIWVDDVTSQMAAANTIAHLRADLAPDSGGWVTYTDRRWGEDADPCVTAKLNRDAVFAHLNRGSGDPSSDLLNRCNETLGLATPAARTYTLVFPFVGTDPETGAPIEPSCECEALGFSDDPDGDGFCSLTIETHGHVLDGEWVNGGLARIGTGSIFKKKADSADIRFMFYHDAGYIGRESFELSSEQPLPIYEDSSNNPGLEPAPWPEHETFALNSLDRGALCSGLEFRFNMKFERQ